MRLLLLAILALVAFTAPGFGQEPALPSSAPTTVAPEAPEVTVAPEAPAATVLPEVSLAPEAPAIFAEAKMLAENGLYGEARAAFERTVVLVPQDPYVRAEFAELLARQAELARTPFERRDFLNQAMAQAEVAQGLAPVDVDVLRVVGETFLAAAEMDPRDGAPLLKALDAFEAIRKAEPNAFAERMTLGQIYLYLGRAGEAATVFQEIVSLNPRDRRASERLADALLKAGKPAEAAQVFADVLAFDPTAEEARFALAEIQAQKGEHQAAVATLRGGSPTFQASSRVRQSLALQLYMGGELAASLAEIEAAGEEGRDRSMEALRALILSAQGKNEEALKPLEGLHASEPDNAEVAMTLAQVLTRLDRRPDAIEVLASVTERLEVKTPERAYGVRLEWAELLLAAGKWDEAEVVLAPLAAAADGRVRRAAALLRSEAQVRLGKVEEALSLLGRLGADDPGVLARRGEILLRADREDEAAAVLDGLGRSDTEDRVLAAASIYQRFERYEKSLEVLTPFLAKHPDSARGLFMAGAAQERSGRFREAETSFRHLLTLAPDFADAQNYLGYMWAERGENLDEALALIEKAVAAEPENGAFVDSLGWVYHRLGRHQEAVEALERAVRLVPDDSTVHDHLGDAYLALGRSKEARAAYLEALKIASAAGAETNESTTLRRKLEQLDAKAPRR